MQYTNPAGYPPLEHSSRLLADAGWQVRFLGTGAHGADALTLAPHPRITVERVPFQPPGWRQKLHYLAFCARTFARVTRFRPAWVYASDAWSAPIALALTHLPLGPRVVYHEHDPPSEARSRVQALVHACRRRLAKRAALCVLPNAERARVFSTETGARRVTCVWNCPTRDEVAPPRPRAGATMWVLYHGSLVPARLPLTVIDALARLPPSVKLRVVGYETVGHPTHLADLASRARALGIEDRLQLVGPVPTRAELLDWCRKSDVGLAFMPKRSARPNEEHMTGASNKPFEYLASGLALLVTDRPDWRALFVDGGYGRACDPGSTASIAEALAWLHDHPDERRQMGERGRAQVQSVWNYEAQFQPVFEALT